VQVHYDEGVASHIGPEPCAGIREGAGEASVGEHAGQPLSRERMISWAPTLSTERKATRAEAQFASIRLARRGRRPWHV
jgi:hypothetical protein